MDLEGENGRKPPPLLAQSPTPPASQKAHMHYNSLTAHIVTLIETGGTQLCLLTTTQARTIWFKYIGRFTKVSYRLLTWLGRSWWIFLIGKSLHSHQDPTGSKCLRRAWVFTTCVGRGIVHPTKGMRHHHCDVLGEVNGKMLFILDLPHR